MTTIYSTTEYGYYQSSDVDYETARAGAAVFLATPNYLIAGQQTGFGAYYCFEAFVSFDTSGVVGPTVASLQFTAADVVHDSVDFILEARLYDWGPSLTDADWVPGADLSALPLLATWNSTDFVPYPGYNVFTDFNDQLNLAGETKIIIVGRNLTDGNAPAMVPGSLVDEYAAFNILSPAGTAADAKLVISDPAPCVPPANDDWADAEALLGLTGSTIGGTTICATMEVGEPAADVNVVGATGTASVWYAWTPPSDLGGEVAFNADPGGTDVVIDVFTGAAIGTLTPVVGAAGYTTFVFPAGLSPTYWVRVNSAVGGADVDFTLAWYFLMNPEPPEPPSPRNLMPRKAGRGRLGCGVNEAYITWKCGTPRFCPVLDTTEITYGRTLNDISEATVVVSLAGTADETCCECLGDVEPWCHELHIARDGVDVWLGPITEVVYEFDKVTIRALDLLGWSTVRIAEVDISNATLGGAPLIDMTVFAQAILDVAFAEDDPCILDYVSSSLTGILGARTFPAYADTAFDQLDAIAQTASLDYTVVGRTTILTGPAVPTTPIATLLDDHIIGTVELTKSGLQQANRWFVHYDDDDTDIPPGPGVASASDQYCCGLIERMKTGTGIPAKESAEQAAQDLLDATPYAAAPRLLEIPDGSQLSPEAPWPFEAMIPGVRIDVGVTRLCVDATQSFRLVGVQVRQTKDGEEVTISTGPLNPLSGEL
jgi:hypothetical protein